MPRPRKYPEGTTGYDRVKATRERRRAQGYAAVQVDLPPDIAAAVDARLEAGETRAGYVLRAVERALAGRA